MTRNVPLACELRARANHFAARDGRSETERLLRAGADEIERRADRENSFSVVAAGYQRRNQDLVAALTVAHAMLIKVADARVAGQEAPVDPAVIDLIETVLAPRKHSQKA